MLRPGCSGAFPLDYKGEETVAYVAEIRQKVKDTAVLKATVEKIRRSMADGFQIPVSVVILLEPKTIPKTTSGKIQRHKCKLGYLEKTLVALHTWEAAAEKKPRFGSPTFGIGGVSQLKEYGTHHAATAIGQDQDDDNTAANEESFYSIIPSPTDSVDGWDAELDLPTKKTVLQPEAPTSKGTYEPEEPESPAETDSLAGYSEGGQSEASASLEAETLNDLHSTFRGGEEEEVLEEDLDERKRMAKYLELILKYVVEDRGLEVEAIDLDQPLTLLGFDSASLVALARAFSDWEGKEISPAVIYKYGTIRELAAFLARGAKAEDLEDKKDVTDLEPDLQGPIAIVGMGCRVSGGEAGDVIGKDAFWRFVLEGGDAVRPDLPPERKGDLDMEPIPTAYLDGVDTFDAHFFGVSQAEALHMDYHQCLTLQTAWHALEDAGIDPSSLSGDNVGVYMGAISHEFSVLEAMRGVSSAFTATGLSNALISNRLSFLLNLRGPSVTIDTACSASMVAIHNAVTDLRMGKCPVALAGGVNLLLNSESSRILSNANLLSSACRTFDAEVSGQWR